MAEELTTPEEVARLCALLEVDADTQHSKPCEMTGLFPDDERDIATALRALLDRVEKAEAEPRWQDIATAPEDQAHIRGMWVYSYKSGSPAYWTADAGYVDNEGDFCYIGGDVTGWRAEDYTHWMPLPEPPEADR